MRRNYKLSKKRKNSTPNQRKFGPRNSSAIGARRNKFIPIKRSLGRRSLGSQRFPGSGPSPGARGVGRSPTSRRGRVQTFREQSIQRSFANDSVIVLDDDSNDGHVKDVTSTVSSSPGTELSNWSAIKSRNFKRKAPNLQVAQKMMIHSTPTPVPRIQQTQNQKSPVQDQPKTSTPNRNEVASILPLSITPGKPLSPLVKPVENGIAKSPQVSTSEDLPEQTTANQDPQQKEDSVRLEDVDISIINPNSLIVLDETVCSEAQFTASVIDLDSDNEETNDANASSTTDHSDSTVRVISVESAEDDDEEDDDVIAISDDEGVNVSLPRKRKLPDFIAVPEMQMFKKLKQQKEVKKGKRRSRRLPAITEPAVPKPSPPPVVLGPLRPIVVDGSNVAFSHGKRTAFSAKGIKIIVDYFVERGHRVHVFVPQFRRRHPQTTDFPLMDEMEMAGVLHYTPSRRVDGRLICSYDDRFIVDFAAQKKAIIITRDNYKDLMDESEEKPQWKETISRRLLQFTFVDDMVLFPDDPLGRNGPRLNEFLRFPEGETPP